MRFPVLNWKVEMEMEIEIERTCRDGEGNVHGDGMVGDGEGRKQKEDGEI
jgi:hypothetical protein